MRWILLLLTVLSPYVATAQDWDALNTPGAFVIARHALAPGTGDPAGFDLDECASQRNLDAAGRAQARAIGAAFRNRGLRFDHVLTSQWCRCRETAGLLALGPVREASAFNSFFSDFSQREARTTEALAVIDALAGRAFIVTHQVNITALTGRGTRSGEALVVRRTQGGLEVLGAILIAP